MSDRQILDAKKIADEIGALRNGDQEYDFICNITSYHLRLFAEGLRSLISAQQTWQPIETAPKTGDFLVYLPDEHRHFQVMHRTERMSIIGGAFAFDISKPTHWCSIPEGPAFPSTNLCSPATEGRGE